MNMALDPLCEYCDLQNTGIDPAFCPEEDAIHIFEDCPSFTLLGLGHFEDFKINLEDILNQKSPLTTKFFIKSGCFTKEPKFMEPISPINANYLLTCVPGTLMGLGFALCAQHNTVHSVQYKGNIFSVWQVQATDLWIC